MDNPQVKEIEIAQDRAMLYIPHNALEGKLEFKIYLDDKIQTVYTILDQDELREAVRKADEGYIDEEDCFVLTDKGRKYLNKHSEFYPN